MSRSMWVAALAVFVMALVPGVAVAAGRSSGGSVDQEQHVVMVLGRGSGFAGSSREVRSLQARLAVEGFSPGLVDGRFGPLTEAAVERFQRADGLVVDGLVGPRTRRGLARAGLLPGAGLVDSNGLARVKSLQRRLARAGFSPGGVDGRYGPLTAAAVKRFQRSHQLPVSGVARPGTLRALASNGERSLRTPASKHDAAQTHKRAGKPNPGRTQKQAGTPRRAPVQTSGRERSGFPWVILLALAAVAAGLLAVVLVGVRRPPAPVQDGAPNGRVRDGAPDGRVRDGAPNDRPSASIVAVRDPMVPAVAISAAQIAALEAAVAMPSAGWAETGELQSTAGQVQDTVTQGHSMVDAPALVPVDKPSPVELPEERFERVKALQRQLTWLGFEPGIVDGRYGPMTTEAVRCFQQVRGLAGDGVADAATLSALRAGTPQRPFSGRVQRVKQLQHELTGRGFEPGPVDGRYGPSTTEAVKRFQRAHDLPDDGIADQATLDALHGHPCAQPFTRRQARVKALQHQLAAVGLAPGPIDGRYGPKTTDAVKRFQRAHELPVDGIADPVTLNALNASVKGSPFIVRTERIKHLQRQLHQLGLKPGIIDGRYGPQTTNAVTRFQQANQLPADGIADPKTLNAIKHNTPQHQQHQLTQTQD